MALTIKNAATIRDDVLRTIKNALQARGVASPNVGPGSDYFAIAQGVAVELATVQNNAAIAADAQMPDTATGPDLDRLLAVYGLSRRAPSSSTGRAIFSTTATTVITPGAELLDSSGNRFTVTAGGTFVNGDSVYVQSVAAGTGTKLAGGSPLRWVSPPPFAASTMLLDANGTSGGAGQESDDAARTRLLATLANPPKSGNATHVASWAEGAGAFVEKAFVYPACNGPGTVHVAVAGPATSSTSRSRAVTSTNVALAASAVQGQLPEFAELVVTSVVDSRVDVSFSLQLPSATTAVPAGIGGGWTDGVPWPNYYDTSTYCASVSAVNSTTDITIQYCSATPTIGASICFVDKSTFTLYTAKVLTNPTNTGTGPYTCRVTLDSPLVGVAVGDFIFPASARVSTYLASVLATFAAFGPGEKTNRAGLLPTAYRRPRTFESWTNWSSGALTKALMNSGSEVYSASLLLPSSLFYSYPNPIGNGPSIYVPQRIAFYPA